MRWRLSLPSGRVLATDEGPGVMAILNVTPDSFSDGGRFWSAESAADEGTRMADLGSVIVDVGGESTRPKGETYGEGALEISSKEEIARVLPVISSLRKKRPSLPISVDTRRLEVARAAFDGGADLLNLVTSLDATDELLSFVAGCGTAIVLGHCRGTPSTTFEESSFTDVVAEVVGDLQTARARAIGSGIPPEKILLDPGFGFGKKPDENFALLAHLADLAPAGTPLVAGASRKAFLGTVAGRPASDRLPESLGAAAAASHAAATHPVLLRVHDVEETIRFLATLARSSG
ncbi:MAG: dihydropteroate synthase [Thermoanaerobaculia bacterium]